MPSRPVVLLCGYTYFAIVIPQSGLQLTPVLMVSNENHPLFPATHDRVEVRRFFMDDAAPFAPVAVLLVLLPRLLIRVGGTGSVHAVY